VSGFSDVDMSTDPADLVAWLDASAAGLAAMKNYMVAAARRAALGGLVVDIGSGAGHDLALLSSAGLVAFGVDPSRRMLEATRQRTPAGSTRLLQADAAHLPLATGTVDACRIERVLQHVEDPSGVVGEMSRVLRRDGLLLAFEPDWSALRVTSDLPGGDGFLASLIRVRHPDIGGRLVNLVEAHGFEVLDEVTEASRTRRLDGLPLRVEATLAKAAAAGRAASHAVAKWAAEQRGREAAGTLRATWTKTLVVAVQRRDS
jgi:SAM-dependent methyltransferase